MNDLNLSLLSTRLDFIDDLEQRGFESFQKNTWTGRVVTTGSEAHWVRVEVHELFPYHPPIVLPTDDDYDDSWHRDSNGGLCLYNENARTDRPWLDVEAFLARIADWYHQASTGWPDDAPDLDLERYFPSANPRLLALYDDLGPLLGKTVRTHRGRNDTLEIIGPAKVPTKVKRTRHRFGYCADLGELTKPVKSWRAIEPLLLGDGPRVAQGIRAGHVRLLLLRYTRSGREAVLALSTVSDGKSIALFSHHSANTSTVVRRLRAGAQAPVLASKSVAVVGCGAIGSFTADGLVRAGVQNLTLQDGDVLRPGNLIRHLCGDAEVGLPKPEAVRQKLLAGETFALNITAVNDLLLSPDAAYHLMIRHDLVIDASADGAVTSLLLAAAHQAQRTAISVCTQNDGDTVRVDLLPPPPGTAALPPTVQRATSGPEAFEGGCGSPISATPAFAVTEAAALTVRYACVLLSHQPLSDAGVAHNYFGATA